MNKLYLPEAGSTTRCLVWTWNAPWSRNLDRTIDEAGDVERSGERWSEGRRDDDERYDVGAHGIG